MINQIYLITRSIYIYIYIATKTRYICRQNMWWSSFGQLIIWLVMTLLIILAAKNLYNNSLSIFLGLWVHRLVSNNYNSPTETLTSHYWQKKYRRCKTTGNNYPMRKTSHRWFLTVSVFGQVNWTDIHTFAYITC